MDEFLFLDDVDDGLFLLAMAVDIPIMREKGRKMEK